MARAAMNAIDLALAMALGIAAISSTAVVLDQRSKKRKKEG